MSENQTDKEGSKVEYRVERALGGDGRPGHDFVIWKQQGEGKVVLGPAQSRPVRDQHDYHESPSPLYRTEQSLQKQSLPSA